jgi:phage tail-like protein
MAEKYPLPKSHFQVEWASTTISFTEVSGLDAETKVIEYRDCVRPEFSKLKMLGTQKFSNVTLKHGVFKSDSYTELFTGSFSFKIFSNSSSVKIAIPKS